MTKTPYRALWHFYKGILPFVLVFTVLCAIIFGPFIAFALFIIAGIPVGLVVFNIVKKQEFYFYYNLGYTKWKLFKSAFVFNTFIGIPIVVILLILINFIFGDLRLI
ncbi:hypothetical protein [Ulvibacter litoralis]|uniref:Uncharacterized protein n=1 Tax=Ulvibacter litoralis TaxID=227084 RepID=A0A1G7F0W8_9FLAO|nr:hypothetical protein [Ulvibacter litoralis]GHC53109.1 hypothetical protein GCM10008083_16360 [Ulvibacter litoralis]SDE69600.1 hypothetical protein SAMN05421855_102263 [Ulvibacter litoralis]